jgi:hypothetical protein
MKQSTIDFLKTLTDGEDPNTGMPVFGIEHGGMFIHDPYLSSCGRFDAKPSDYGLTKESADVLVGFNGLIDESAEAAINAACLSIQTRLGIVSGDVAGIAFSDDSLKIAIAKAMRTYIFTEAWMAQEIPRNDEVEADSENSASPSAPRPNRPQF